MQISKLLKTHHKKIQSRRSLHRKARSKLGIHKRFFLHPFVFSLYLAAGIILIFSSTSAADILVTAKVSAPLITEPAVLQTFAPLEKPTNVSTTQGATTPATVVSTENKQIIVNGECPKNSYLQFYRNGDFAGVAPCVGDPTFTITIDLVVGLNKIEAKVFNITDDEGPMSVPFYINFTPPAVASTIESTAIPISTKDKMPFLIYSTFDNLGFHTNTPARWTIHIQGGKAPYKISIDWGDNSPETNSVEITNAFDVTHTYTKASERTGFIVTVKATDATNEVSVFQMMAIVSNKGTSTANLFDIANSNLKPSIAQILHDNLKIIWAVYAGLSILIASYWLGERHEYNKLRKTRKFILT